MARSSSAGTPKRRPERRPLGAYPQAGDEKPNLSRIDRASRWWNYCGPFGFTAGLADGDEAPYPLDMRVTGELLRQKETALVGRADEVTAALLRMKELVGAEDFAPVPLRDAGPAR